MKPEELRTAADWLGARLKAAPRPIRVGTPDPLAASPEGTLPLFVAIPAVTPVKPPVAAVSKRGGGASNACLF